MSGFVRVAARHAACTTLGPGTRFVLWVQGCPLSCRGCVSPQWIPFDGGTMVPVAELVDEIARTAVDGLTISGGEPFAQAGALASLIAAVRERRDLSVLCFSGYTMRHLREHGGPDALALLGQLDLLIDGPYLAERHADLRWRGSSNQRIHRLTARHAAEPDEGDDSAGLQIEILGDGSVQWLGVPATPDFRTRFEAVLGISDSDDGRK